MTAARKKSKKNSKRISSPNQLRYLQLSNNVNDYDTGETEIAPEKNIQTVNFQCHIKENRG